MSVFSHENQHKFIQIAGKLKQGNPLSSGEELLIAEIMSQHPEFIPIWELGDLSASPQEINGEVINPFVHTALHLAMEKQIDINDPAEVVEVINRLIDKGMDRHKVIHQIGGVYASLYFSSLRKGEMFEEYSYIEIVRQITKEK
jgi:hypothetical protein